MSIDRINYLLQRLFQNNYTSEEKEELALWIETLRDDEDWKLRLEEIWNQYEPNERMNTVKADAILETILKAEKQPPQTVKIVKHYYRQWAAAAAILILIAVSTIYFLRKQTATKTLLTASNIKSSERDIQPGGNKAILTLANGVKVVLDSAHNGSLAQQGNIRVIKLDSGQLAYSRQSSVVNGQSAVQYNTLSTPRGGQYMVILPDGSKVCLNAASSLKFPTAFTGKERAVTLTGEAYFEVVNNKERPFKVHVGNIQVEDLGTHFNVMAYNNEPAIKTTLIEGAVKVTRSSPPSGEEQGVRLQPGQQAVLNKSALTYIKVQKVNPDETVAWKNGLFEFEGNDIKSVMRQIARWYDVDIKYENTTSAHFMGTISRNVNVSEVLKMLEMTRAVHFKIEGRTITVLS